jgi:RNA polymerase sigma factor (sigma-70 family)
MLYYGPGTDDISYVPLTIKEEKKLFHNWYSGSSIKARDEIIARHLKLVAKLALAVSKNLIPADEAISAGNVALMEVLSNRRFDPVEGILTKHVRRFDPCKGRFATFLRKHVRGAVCRAIRDLEPIGGWSAAPQHDEETNPKTDGPEQVLKSLDLEAREGPAGRERRQLLEKYFSFLKPREAHTIRGMALEGKTQVEVGRELSISREGARQLYERGMLKLQKMMRKTRQDFL